MNLKNLKELVLELYSFASDANNAEVIFSGIQLRKLVKVNVVVIPTFTEDGLVDIAEPIVQLVVTEADKGLNITWGDLFDIIGMAVGKTYVTDDEAAKIRLEIVADGEVCDIDDTHRVISKNSGEKVDSIYINFTESF